MDSIVELVTPGFFGATVSADSRRMDFDFSNEQILYMNRQIDYLFIGDSITQLWNLNAYFKTDKYMENRAIGGDNSVYLSKRFDADCIQLHPKKVIMMIGTNDVARTDEDLWWRIPGESVQKVLKEYKDNVLQMIKKCDEAGIEVILCSILPSKIAPPYNRELRWEMTKQMNEFLQSLGKTYVDYHSLLTEDGCSLSDDLSPDGIHPNAKAYSIMAKKLSEVLDIQVRE